MSPASLYLMFTCGLAAYVVWYMSCMNDHLNGVILMVVKSYHFKKVLSFFIGAVKFSPFPFRSSCSCFGASLTPSTLFRIPALTLIRQIVARSLQFQGTVTVRFEE